LAYQYAVGGGGGFNTLEPTPSCQEGVPGTRYFNAVQYLTPTDYQKVDGIVESTEWNFNPSRAVSHGFGSGRPVPDVSTSETGYLEYSLSCAPGSRSGRRLGRDQFRSSPAEREDGCQRLLSGPPGGLLKSLGLRFRDPEEFTLYAARAERHQQRQHLPLHGNLASALQRGQRLRLPEPG
jgi:hypothetical protein